MKRSGHLKRYTPLKARKPWQPERKPLKRTPLKKKSTSPTAQIKGNIQALLREIVIIRDGGCILRDLSARIRYLYEVPDCNGYRKDGELILQADHLITRGNNATYADSRLVVCVCQGHHGWKSIAGNMRKPQYDAIVRALLPPDRVELWDRCEADSWRPTRKGSYDWRLEEAALRQELAKLRE